MWGKQKTFAPVSLRVKTPSSEDGCEPYSFGTPSKPTAYLVNGLKKCPLLNLIHNAQEKGAQAIFVVNSEDTDIKDVVPIGNLPGVHIHVFLVNKDVGETLIQFSKLEGDDQELRVRLDLIQFARNHKDVSIKVFYAPDDPSINQLMAEIYESDFRKDIIKRNLIIDRQYTILSCSECEDNGYRFAQTNCLSGGRYCLRSANDPTLTGEVMLVQILKNQCFEQNSEPLQQANYYWTFNNSCLKEFSPRCSNTILEKLGLKDKVFECMKNSFVPLNSKEVNPAKPLILMQDNRILANTKKTFAKVENFTMFPMVQINGMVFYGSNTFQEVMSFACNHLKRDLEGCHLVVDSTPAKTPALFLWLVWAIFLVVVLGLMEICRRALKKKFTNDTKYQIDQQISSFLERSGDAM